MEMWFIMVLLNVLDATVTQHHDNHTSVKFALHSYKFPCSYMDYLARHWATAATRKIGMLANFMEMRFIMVLSYCCLFLCFFCWPFLNLFNSKEILYTILKYESDC